MSPICPGYVLKKELGQGGFGTVYLAHRTSDRMRFAIKVIEHSTADVNLQDAEEEVFVLRHLQHPNIVSFVDVIQKPKRTFVVMEYCGGGDLREVINRAISARTIIPEARIRAVLVQLILALHHCHHFYFKDWSLIHRDIKPENVLFTREGTVKLADFGLSKVLDDGVYRAQSFVGTLGYLAPEILTRKSYDSKADMFSLGCLLLEMCTLKFPDEVTPAGRTANQAGLHLPPAISAELRAIIEDLLHDTPGKRPSTADLLSRRSIGSWLQQRETTSNAGSLAADTVLTASNDREEELRKREKALRSRERALEAKEASLEARLRRLNFRSSTSPPAGLVIRNVTKSPSPSPARTTARKLNQI